MQCPPPLTRTNYLEHITLLEGETFLRKKHKIAFFLNKMHIFLVEKKTTLVLAELSSNPDR